MKMNYSNVGRGLSDIAGAVEKRRTKKMLQDAYGNAKRDAEAGSGVLHTIDKGGDDPDMADYSSKDKSTIDMIAGQEDFINEAPVREQTRTQTRTAQGAETFGLGDRQRIQGDPLPAGYTGEGETAAAALEAGAPAGLESITAKPAMSPVPGSGPEMSAAPAAGTTAPPAEAPKPAYTRESFERPQLNATDIFHKKYAPQVVAKMMENGDVDKAQAFEAWSRSAKGAAYGDAYMRAAMAENAGDTRGALAGVQELYNKMVPDGQYAVVKPGKDGDYTVEVRDEKSNKLVGTQTGKGEDIARLGLGMLSPAEVYKQMHGAQVAASNDAKALAKETRENEFKLKLEAAKGNPTELAKLHKELAAIEGADPKDPRIADYRRVISNKGTHAPATTFNVGTSPQGLGGNMVVATNKDGSGARAVPIAGMPTKQAQQADIAEKALTGVTLQRDPPSPDNPNPSPYYMRGGVKIPAYTRGKPNPEFAKLREYEQALREDGRVPSWERKREAPGLK